MSCWTPEGWDEAKVARHMQGLHDGRGGHGQYCANLDRWRARFGDEVRVFFYEQLATDPTSFCAEVCAFLGLDPADRREMAPPLRRRVFEGPSIASPLWMQAFLRDIWRDEIRSCHARFANAYTESWLRHL